MTATNSSPLGILCDCGSSNVKVVRKTPRPGFNLRRIECRDCKRRFTTRESRLDKPSPSQAAIGSGLAAVAVGQLRETLRLLNLSATSES